MNLDRMTHHQLDVVAATRGVTPYPATGTKAEKADAIRAALPVRATVVSRAPLTGWPAGEVREIVVDSRLLRRAARGLVHILSTDEPDIPATTPPDRVYGDEPSAPLPSYPSDPEPLRGDLTS